MFGLDTLFNEEDDGGGGGRTHGVAGIKAPPPPRLPSGLCGLYNQGATCYMNSLLQTLLLTPEFREGLFQLGQFELGKLEEKHEQGKQVRVIPLELQRLFSRLLLLNQQAASTADLTDSFGWSNNEELQQHDAQELNRILFSALEDSLIGTPGADLIQRLYHGITVNQITCQKCGNVSERKEEFLDLTVSVTGTSSLQEVLANMFVNKEVLDGSNQYHCSSCAGLVDATKGAVIRHLPDILTISLLRFSFDFVKMERYKETGKFSFPLRLDMEDYCELNVGDTEYELFSVVIHRGSTHGGHYHAYIKDVDSLGHWTHPDREEILVPTDPATGKVDYIELDSPIELVQAILLKSDQQGMAIDKLGAEINKHTGVSWNKRFKRHWGPMNKFLKKYDDKFVYDEATKTVSLKSYSNNQPSVTPQPVIRSKVKDAEKSHNPTDNKRQRPDSPLPEEGQCWFNFDDSRISPIRESDIEKQFSGKESAYMLFYRRRSMVRPKEAWKNPAHHMSDPLQEWVMMENIKLSEEREEYEKKINSIKVEVHFVSGYHYLDGALKALPGALNYIELTLDRRKTVTELKKEITELAADLMSDEYVIHTAKDLPAGLHLYHNITGDLSASLMSQGVYDGTKLFVWDGVQVNGGYISCGPDCEPLLLHVQYSNPSQFTHAYPKNMTQGELRLKVAEFINSDPDSFNLSRVITKGDEVSAVSLMKAQDGQTLDELKISNGESIVVEQLNDTRGSLVEEAVASKSKLVSFIVENRCQDFEGDTWPVTVIEITKESTVEELKTITVSKLSLENVEGGGHLRIDDDKLGLRPPLHEEQDLAEAGLRQGARLVLEPGAPPTQTQMTLTCALAKPKGDQVEVEVMVEKKTTVQECLGLMICKIGLAGDGWHLRKTNWCLEPAEVLDDLDATLDDCQIKNGSHLLLEEGKLPPKDYLKLTICLLPTPGVNDGEASQGMLAWLTSGIQGLLGGGEADKTITGDNVNTQRPDHVQAGDIIIHKTATLEDLKEQVLTLPLLSCMTVPTLEFLRVRLIENNQPSVVLRENNLTLQRLKLTSSSVLGVQCLQEEETLSPYQVLLNVRIRVPENRSYLPARELIWNTSSGPDAHALKQAVAAHVGLSVHQISIAKHFPEKYEWMVITEHGHKAHKNHDKGKKRTKKNNLKHAPYHLKDGDIIGVKDLQNDLHAKDDFCTAEDEAGKERLKKEAEEKKRKRLEMKKNMAAMDIGSGDTRRRQEPSLSIKVANFR